MTQATASICTHVYINYAQYKLRNTMKETAQIIVKSHCSAKFNAYDHTLTPNWATKLCYCASNFQRKWRGTNSGWYRAASLVQTPLRNSQFTIANTCWQLSTGRVARRAPVKVEKIVLVRMPSYCSWQTVKNVPYATTFTCCWCCRHTVCFKSRLETLM